MRDIRITFRVTDEEYDRIVRGLDEIAMLEAFARAFEDGDYSPVMPSTKERLDQPFMITYKEATGRYSHVMRNAVSKQECLDDVLIRAHANVKIYSMAEIERICNKEYHELSLREGYIKYNSAYILEA